jgi:hypothetical protein
MIRHLCIYFFEDRCSNELRCGVFARIGQDRWDRVGVAEGRCIHFLASKSAQLRRADGFKEFSFSRSPAGVS